MATQAVLLIALVGFGLVVGARLRDQIKHESGAGAASR